MLKLKKYFNNSIMYEGVIKTILYTKENKTPRKTKDK